MMVVLELTLAAGVVVIDLCSSLEILLELS